MAVVERLIGSFTSISITLFKYWFIWKGQCVLMNMARQIVAIGNSTNCCATVPLFSTTHFYWSHIFIVDTLPVQAVTHSFQWKSAQKSHC